MRSSALRLAGAAALLIASCSSSAGIVSEREAAEIALNGLNQTGLELAITEWRNVGEEACERGVWDHGAARTFAESLSAKYSPRDPSALPLVVWMAAVTACAELVPEAALKLGPPLPEGG
jgi:hypothetical protein